MRFLDRVQVQWNLNLQLKQQR
ncbi:F0F1 ATP synthase subunit delta [Crocosphaera chwakensis CCY0110]|uniref:F0F1 ATP synthase subunit delta n=1 Tax=Crocosphaera chwakensis CCY0110 TaxID=391612 RepID=A3IIQ6_9CHRO|nr:F0F1 ATP synthase subunit delta [Crocosphaera chwakensis CCY0110]